MIQLQGISKSYGLQILLEDSTFQVGVGERVGISGRNGHGKSTLFRIILGEESPDSGRVEIPRGYTLGHLSQHLSFTHPTVLEEAAQALPMHDGAWREDHLAEEILAGLGFGQESLSIPPAKLSGGFQVRLNLAKALLAKPRMLLLDEPTNYLDITSSRWLERFLRAWKGEMLLITHDRSFMDAVCTHVVGIHRRRCRKVQGSVDKLWETLLSEEELAQRTAHNEARKREQLEKFISRFRAQANKAKAVQSRIKALARAEADSTPDLAPDTRDLDFQFRSAPFPGKRVLQLENISFRYSENSPWLVRNLSLEVQRGDRIAIIGPNGRGKTTLLNLIARDILPVAGEVEINPNAVMAYFGQTNVQRLDPLRTVEDEILATLNLAQDFNRGRARSLAGLMMFEGDAALKKIRVLSGGERSRVLLAKILATPCNLLLLDEPTNHLDMESVESLTEACEDFPGSMLLVTHDEDILRRLATRLIVFDGGQAVVFEGGYDEFLERVGWSGERSMTKALPLQSVSTKETSTTEKPKTTLDRAARAKAIDNRNRILRPLEKQVQDLENKIAECESQYQDKEGELLAASGHNDSVLISELSKEMHLLEKKRDSLYIDLELSSQDLETKRAQYPIPE